MLAASDLSLKRGGERVLTGVSAQFEPGAITAIVGPNGAGKSSLLMALAGLLDPESGHVELDGTALDETPLQQRARAIGYLPQGADIAWDVSVEALVALGRMPHGDSRREPVHAALSALDLVDFRNRPISTLSGGERARALLARVLAGEPRWILADEPLAALDLAHQMRLIGHLRDSTKTRVKVEGSPAKGVIIVLHDLALAMNHADHVIVLDKGRIAAQGAPSEALSQNVIEQVWGVSMEWLGEPGRYALAPNA